MERIEYGSVSMDVIQTIKFDRSAVLDEVGNYLMTKWEVEAICHFHPFIVSFELRNPLPIVPVFMQGKLPGETDRAILSYLLKPRQLLKITAGGETVLETPSMKAGTGNRYPCDAMNGPRCEFVSAPRQIGEKHWMVHCRWVAHVNECTSSTSIVLSNVWTSTFDVDEVFLPVRFVAGKAILRTDMMREQHITADNFRADFFFPLDANYVRENVNVKLAEDGATLFWSFTDVGRNYNVAGTSPIRKVDIFRTTYSKAGTGALAMRQVAQRAELSIIANGVPILPTSIAASARAVAADTFRTALDNMPRHHLNIRCDVWGDRNSTNRDLTKIALGICLNQGIASNVPFAITTGEVACYQHLTEKVVSTEITYRWSDEFAVTPGFDQIIVPSAVQGPNAQGGITILNSNFLNYPTIYGRTIPGNVQEEQLFQRDAVNPAPLNQSQSTLIENLVVQALLSPCEGAPNPDPLGMAS